MKTKNFQIVLRCKTNFNSTIICQVHKHTDTIFGLSHCFSTLLNTAINQTEIGEDFVQIDFSIEQIK